MKKSVYILVGAALAGVMLIPSTMASASSDEPKLLTVPDAALTQAPSIASADLLGPTALPLVSEAMSKWSTETQNALAETDAFSTVRLADDRKSAAVYWFGEQSLELREAIAAASFPVEVVKTQHEPGALRDAATRIIQQPDAIPGITIRSTAAEPDGSGIAVGVDKVAPSSARNSGPVVDLEQQLVAIAGTSGVPITVETETTPSPGQGRLDNDVQVAGGRVYRGLTGVGCSTSFTTTRGGTTPIRGQMFAAHCVGSVGEQWTRPVAGNINSRADYGKVVSRQPSRDGAILEGRVYQNAVYIGSYTSDAAVKITGVSNPVANSEICYSGSFSGTVCGNMVTRPNVNYNLGGDLQINGLLTQNTPGNYPGAGNGDSGGPGIVPVASANGTVLYAGTVISAIPDPSPATCQGVPGVPGDSGRKCSVYVYSTRASEIASQAGVSIMTN